MPRSDDAIITVKLNLHNQWKRLCRELGYGERGKQKLLGRMLNYTEEHRELFEVRK